MAIERGGRALLERGEGAIALALAASAVDRLGVDADLAELLGEAIGTVTGAGEHDRRAEAVDDLGRGVDALFAGDGPEQVLRGVHVGALGADLVTGRVALEVGDELGDRTVERGREQQHLTVAAGLLDDAANRGQEAHVGHLVGFVDHDGGDVTQVEGTHLEEVLQAAGAGDDDFDALVERTLLRAVADAAVDGDGRVAFGLGEAGRSRP